ncbi:GPI ethanolamine phosphate transferase 2 isoform X5 [Monodelphis domestica]|uniref:GPI ethanolamine phosphate transferase 2 isoform X5 n=1 Tax=Monodelphis domestica TaxID=13616 RepID=UPI00044329B8|nr:GPI ethanolamine phosphate transferase 2 isoform X5 [Monodelphis domestica]
MRLGSGVFAACCVVIQVLGVAVFLRGFFPVSLRPVSQVQPQPPAPEPAAGTSSNWTQLPPAIFRKVIIMLVDALRDDFVFGSKGVQFMPYTKYLMEKGFAHNFIAEAKPPTVTMPRIKALMTGSIPGFIDVVMNFNSPVLLEDNLIGQAKAAGKRVIFYGDDTWIKLFPKHFVEYDGTTSFFVPDFKEVDDNVTRHLDTVLKREDWDILILHYLGLDHIGHLTGPHSSLIGPKLKEMDYILKKIHISLLSKEKEASLPHLLVLCGDHGMSEAGGHGASSVEEVSTPLLLISSAFHRKMGNLQPPKHVQQTDLAATLAVGLGLPIPKNSVGSILYPVVEKRTMREQLRFLHLNSVQLSRLLQENVPMYEKDPGFQQFKVSEKLHGNWIKLYLEGNNSEVLLNLGKKVLKQYLDALKTLSMSLSKQVAQYDMYSMMVGAIIVLEITILLLLSTPKALCQNAAFEIPLSSSSFSLLFYLMVLILSAVHVIICTSAERTCFLCSISWLMAVGVMMLISALLCVIVALLTKTFENVRPSAQNLAASSSGWSELDLLILFGTLGHVLSLGASSFIEEEHQTWYFLINTLCLALGHEVFRNHFLGKDLDHNLAVEQNIKKNAKNVLQYKNDYVDVPETSKIYKASSSMELLPKVYEKWLQLASPWFILICCRLLRTLNQTGVQWAHRLDFGHWLTSSDHKIELSVLTCLSLIMIFVLVQRRCSSVSKVAMALGLLGVFCYRAAIGNVLLPWQRDRKSISKSSAISHASFCYALICSIPVSAYIILVTSLRYHLFIWSVFSPKLLYEGVHLFITATICVFFIVMDQTNLIKP